MEPGNFEPAPLLKDAVPALPPTPPLEVVAAASEEKLLVSKKEGNEMRGSDCGPRRPPLNDDVMVCTASPSLCALVVWVGGAATGALAPLVPVESRLFTSSGPLFSRAMLIALLLLSFARGPEGGEEADKAEEFDEDDEDEDEDEDEDATAEIGYSITKAARQARAERFGRRCWLCKSLSSSASWCS
jgi:hypothetical protein